MDDYELTPEQAEELLERMMPGRSPEVRMSIVTLVHQLIESGATNGIAHSLGPSKDGRYVIVEVRYEDGRSVVEETARLQEENDALRELALEAEWGDMEDDMTPHVYCPICHKPPHVGHHEACLYRYAYVSGYLPTGSVVVCTEHVIVKQEGLTLECTHCGEVQVSELPMPVADWLRRATKFERKHKHCQPRSEERPCVNE